MKFRYRLHLRLFRKPLLVLQVHKTGGGRVENVGGGVRLSPPFDRWVDADIHDVAEVKEVTE